MDSNNKGEEKEKRGKYSVKVIPDTIQDDIKTNLKDVANMPTVSNVKVDNEGHNLSKEQQGFFKDSKITDEKGNLKVMYHGTGRADRVGYYFDPNRATSGPMAYFTDNQEIAENYSKDKKDTSLDYDERYNDYHTQFRVKT